MKKKMKMSMCIFFYYFQWVEQIINIDEKKNWCNNVGWAAAQIILWELYCKAVIVL